MPLISPPPPTGTTTVASSGTSSSSSSPSVPCPATISAIVERVHEDGAGLVRTLARLRDAVVDRVAAEPYRPAEAAHRRHLGERGLRSA